MSTAAVALIPGAFTTAAAHADQIPEWYQYCHDRIPGQELTQSGRYANATPPYFYGNPVAGPGGVDCKYQTAMWGFVPHTVTVHHSWNQVCHDMGLGRYSGWRKYPFCSR